MSLCRICSRSCWLTLWAAHWTNLNGSVANTTIGYDVQANLLFLTGDLDAFNGLNNNTAEAVVRTYLSDRSALQTDGAIADLLPRQVNAKTAPTELDLPRYDPARPLPRVRNCGTKSRNETLHGLSDNASAHEFWTIFLLLYGLACACLPLRSLDPSSQPAHRLCTLLYAAL